ncbi:MAG: T9SS type A sorting domain-containing protein [Lentimicrobiaceae bacterium]|jgi:hypothetical protein|nr:T9SS type A sorting domain-containing protein [Lentimicrobiaceae bacterium]MBT3455157.1 T9SS type A sorting domain-containing protein [Lentimicrobiaceae bacterium]MBT3819385.1 T9SS type A sorting domain-containing protein [Lentimicrobiaceae bacterium]MBT4060921.1 T9SS type A sorting domain-containing protein [Lentimicrobiaceae bacterium]MBT4191272.1 T9SS type A sorting domain-containing protein [Lentimicrobiaceae bacterium]
MRKFILLFLSATFVIIAFNIAISDSSPTERQKRSLVNTRIDNNGYWKKAAKKGLTVLNPVVKVPTAVYTGNTINSRAVVFDNSPDVPVTTEPSTQSENSIFVDPNDNLVALNSNNSTPANGGSVYGADYLFTEDFAATWDGSINGPNGSNSGDPAACIGTDGRWYVGYISNGGQGVSYSDDQGDSWTKVQVAAAPGTGWGDLADKNHMWIDAKQGSPYENYLYNAWTDFGGPFNNEIVLQRSMDRGETWDTKVNLSGAINTSGHCQGVNISTGPNGEAYAVWSIYDNWPNDENSIGMARSFDGGATWEPAFRIIDNIRGIRNSGVPQNMRVNSFPVMAVDASDGPNSGTIYVVWTNTGVPGTNTGSDRDVYLIKSTDQGDTWTDPIRVNQDPIGQGKAHYLPWITCDASSGILSVIFLDNRNTTASQAEAWVAVSTNAGETWEDFKVSDVAFTPSPIPGLASGYFGDYLSIHSSDGKVYPCWTDNRSGQAMGYVSVFETINLVAPFALLADTDQETGEVTLDWQFNGGTGFEYFKIYRNGEVVSTTTELAFTETLVDYGYYLYEVTAIFVGDQESLPAAAQTQYGTSTIVITPESYTAVLNPEATDVQMMHIHNTGVLDLDYSLSPFFGKSSIHEYEVAKGGGDEYINIVRIANLENYSSSDLYSNNSSLSANLNKGELYPIEVVVANAYEGDQVKVWFDWNQNGVFDETAVILNDDKRFGVFIGEVTIPQGATPGKTGMRVRLSSTDKLSAYNDTQYGEVEDYSIVIPSWLTLDPDTGIIPPGDSLMVNVIFNAEGLTIGSYYYEVEFITNDLFNPSYGVDFTLHVTDIQLSVSADPAEICMGESTQLLTNVSGGSGSYTYSWTSVPEGFVSSEPSPVVYPEVNTVYNVEVYDGSVTIESNTTVIVHELPVVELGNNETLCGETQIILNAGNPGQEYLWSTNETTQEIVAMGTGETMFWAEVINEYGCVGYDTIFINFAEIPVVDLGADTVVCGGTYITLDAGNPGSNYLWSNLETSQTIEVDTSNFGFGLQDYSVQVTTQDGCYNDGQITVEFVDCTGLNEVSNLEMNIYPNPSNGVFNIGLSASINDPVEIIISDQTGKVVYELSNVVISNNSLKVNLNGYSDGIYGITILQNGSSLTSRVVLRR